MRNFIWGVILATLFLSWGSQKYYTYWAVRTRAPLQSQNPRGCDFDVYYAHIAHTGQPELEAGWFYPEHAAVELAWIGWFPKSVSYVLWTAVMVGSYFIFLSKLLEVELGWLMALLTLKPFTLVILAGNIAAALPILCLSPIGMVLASSFKCYCAGFLLVFAAREILARRKLGRRSYAKLEHSHVRSRRMGDLSAATLASNENLVHDGIRSGSIPPMG